MHNDKETNKIIEESKKIKALIEHEAWPHLRGCLIERIRDLVDLSNIKLDGKPEDIAMDMKARKKAADVLFDFLTIDIEGQAKVADNYSFTLTRKDYIVRE